mmetsp:Transcript_9714/g.14956  ORF Transcript_9714/g.14956 Transcript_9714/m.14956 type:complete len:145 (+) Transcript_9714:1571-2005(+)
MFCTYRPKTPSTCLQSPWPTRTTAKLRALCTTRPVRIFSPALFFTGHPLPRPFPISRVEAGLFLYTAGAAPRVAVSASKRLEELCFSRGQSAPTNRRPHLAVAVAAIVPTPTWDRSFGLHPRQPDNFLTLLQYTEEHTPIHRMS